MVFAFNYALENVFYQSDEKTRGTIWLSYGSQCFHENFQSQLIIKLMNFHCDYKITKTRMYCKDISKESWCGQIAAYKNKKKESNVFRFHVR